MPRELLIILPLPVAGALEINDSKPDSLLEVGASWSANVQVPHNAAAVILAVPHRKDLHICMAEWHWHGAAI